MNQIAGRHHVWHLVEPAQTSFQVFQASECRRSYNVLSFKLEFRATLEPKQIPCDLPKQLFEPTALLMLPTAEVLFVDVRASY